LCFFKLNLVKGVKVWLKIRYPNLRPISYNLWIIEFKPGFNWQIITIGNFWFQRKICFSCFVGKVRYQSSNLATRCELGTPPIKIKCYNLMFRYYTRFREIDGQPGGQYDTQALVSFKKYMPPLPYFKVNICPFVFSNWILSRVSKFDLKSDIQTSDP
jgi:hypothetical protein